MVRDRYQSGHPGYSLKIFLFIVGIVFLAFAALEIFHTGGLPDIRIEPAMPIIGKRTPVKVEISEPRRGLTHVKVELRQDNKSAILEEKSYRFTSQFSFWGQKTEKDVLQVEAGSQSLPGLTGGNAVVRVTVDRAGTYFRHPGPEVQEVSLPVRLIPPSLQITSTQINVTQGGCELVTYKVGDSAVRDGVRAGDWWFPGYPLPGATGKNERFSLFAVPYDMSRLDVKLVAEDAAGNVAQMGFIDRFSPRSFKSDSLHISDAFINKVVPEILMQSPEMKDRGNPLDNYLAINRELRLENAETIKSLSQKSKPAFLWTKPFLELRNSKVTAHFGDRRTYLYNGKVIDHQNHLGYDLAATRHAPVTAANDGIIVHAGFFGIYGNAVIIDHGFGLMTIYGHLSSIAVSEGQKVARGDVIGKTGETGLAGGDHLHFCTLLQGLPVDPVEWWDGRWIKDHIARKLGPAFQFSTQ